MSYICIYVVVIKRILHKLRVQNYLCNVREKNKTVYTAIVIKIVGENNCVELDTDR